MSFQVAPNEDVSLLRDLAEESCTRRISDDENEQWNYIAELTGDDSWSAASMHQYFTAVENCTYVPEGSSEEHGWGGFMSVCFINH